jgi:hypothetical protein
MRSSSKEALERDKIASSFLFLKQRRFGRCDDDSSAAGDLFGTHLKPTSNAASSSVNGKN